MLILGLPAFWHFRRAPALTGQYTILITDSVSIAGDTVFDETLKESLTAKLGGDLAKSRKAYQDFHFLWEDADPGIPILKEAAQSMTG